MNPSDAPTGSSGFSGYSANLPPYASPPRHRGVPGQPRRVDGSVLMGVPSFQLDTSRRHPAAGASSRAARGSRDASAEEAGTADASAALGDPKKKGKHRRNSSLPTKEYLATLGFGGVGLDEAFDLGGNRTRRLKEAEAREAERFERLREIQEEEKKNVGAGESGPQTSTLPTQKNVGARLDSILSGIGKTPIGKQQNSVGSNHPPVGTPAQTGRAPSRHNRRGSTGLLLFDAAAALASDPAVGGQKAHGGFRRPNSGSDLAAAPTSAAAGTTIGAEREREPNASAGEASQNQGIGIVPLENRREPFPAGSAATAARVSKLDRTTRAVGPAVDHIGAGSVTPLLASDVKRVLEHVADAHRARHRRQRSAESGGRGSGSNSNSNSPSHSRHGSFRDLSLMDTRSGSPSDGDGDFGGGRTKTTSGVSSRKPSVENAEYFDGWVGSEDEDAPDVAIDHDWWAGLNIDEDSDDDPDHNPERFEAYYVDPKTEDYEGSRHGGVGVSSANAFLPSGKMPARGVAVDGSSRMSYEDDRDERTRAVRANGDTVHVKPDVMDAMERGAAPSPGDATSASAAKGAARAARMVEMPVPDVNARRTVNTYDPIRSGSFRCGRRTTPF